MSSWGEMGLQRLLSEMFVLTKYHFERKHLVLCVDAHKKPNWVNIFKHYIFV